MLYLGSTLSNYYGQSEPSLFNPRLKVAKGIVDIAERLTHYWPSYDTIFPETRRAYLQPPQYGVIQFPTEDAITKLFYLELYNISK